MAVDGPRGDDPPVTNADVGLDDSSVIDDRSGTCHAVFELASPSQPSDSRFCSRTWPLAITRSLSSVMVTNHNC